MRGILRMIPASYGVAYLPLTQLRADNVDNNAFDLLGFNAFEQALIDAGITSDMYVVYPFRGGDSTKNSFNFMAHGANQLTYFGGLTHSNNGMLGNGTSGYANTGWNPFVSGIQSNIGITYCSRTNRTKDYGGLGVYSQVGIIPNFMIFPRDTSNTVYLRINNNAFVSALYSGVTDSSGVWTAERIDGVNQTLYRNGASLGNVASASAVLPNFNFFIMATSNGNAGEYYNNEEYSFVAIHKGLGATKVALFHTAIQNLQTYLGR